MCIWIFFYILYIFNICINVSFYYLVSIAIKMPLFFVFLFVDLMGSFFFTFILYILKKFTNPFGPSTTPYWELSVAHNGASMPPRGGESFLMGV